MAHSTPYDPEAHLRVCVIAQQLGLLLLQLQNGSDERGVVNVPRGCASDEFLVQLLSQGAVVAVLRSQGRGGERERGRGGGFQ